MKDSSSSDRSGKDQLSPKKMEQLIHKGLKAFNDGDYENAVEDWETVCALDKSNYRVLTYLSLAYDQMEAPELSRGALMRALKANPNYGKAWNNLGNSFRETGELFRAVDAYEKAVRLRADSADYRYNLGITYFDTLQYAPAIEQFRIYRSMAPTDDSILLLLATAYYQDRQPNKALACVRVFLQRHPKTRKFARLRAKMRFLRNIIEHPPREMQRLGEAAPPETDDNTPPPPDIDDSELDIDSAEFDSIELFDAAEPDLAPGSRSGPPPTSLELPDAPAGADGQEPVGDEAADDDEAADEDGADAEDGEAIPEAGDAASEPAAPGEEPEADADDGAPEPMVGETILDELSDELITAADGGPEADEPKPDEPKPDEPKPDEPKPDEPKPEADLFTDDESVAPLAVDGSDLWRDEDSDELISSEA